MANTTTSCSSLLESLDWCEGAPQLAGIRRRAYIANVADIVKFAELPKDAIGRVTSAELAGSFELVADKKWQHIDFNPESSQHTSEPQNEAPSMLQLNKLTLVHPGVGPEATRMAAAFNNSNVVVVWQDMNGRWRVTGSNLYRNKVTTNQDNGQGATGTPSTTFNVEAYDYIPSPFYTGKLDSDEGEIDCSTAKAE